MLAERQCSVARVAAGSRRHVGVDAGHRLMGFKQSALISTVVLLWVSMLAVPAFASCELSSARVNNTLVKVGDSDRRVLSADPDRTVQLTTSAGGSAGIRYDFYQRGVTIQVYVAAGRVTRVCRIRD